MKSQILHTVLCNIAGEAAGELLDRSLLGVKGLSVSSAIGLLLRVEFRACMQSTTGHYNPALSWSVAKDLFVFGETPSSRPSPRRFPLRIIRVLVRVSMTRMTKVLVLWAGLVIGGSMRQFDPACVLLFADPVWASINFCVCVCAQCIGKDVLSYSL